MDQIASILRSIERREHELVIWRSASIAATFSRENESSAKRAHAEWPHASFDQRLAPSGWSINGAKRSQPMATGGRCRRLANG
jgi:hypothetical protein